MQLFLLVELASRTNNGKYERVKLLNNLLVISMLPPSSYFISTTHIGKFDNIVQSNFDSNSCPIGLETGLPSNHDKFAQHEQHVHLLGKHE